MGINTGQLLQVLGIVPPSNDMTLTPYRFNDTKVLVGVPPYPLVGLEYVSVRHLNPQVKRFQCLSGRGVFASNINTSGVVEIGMLRGSVSQGQIAKAQVLGIPYPIYINDLGSGGTAQVLATGCQLIQTPEWKREALPGINIYTFETTRLFVAHGIQLPYVVI